MTWRQHLYTSHEGAQEVLEHNPQCIKRGFICQVFVFSPFTLKKIPFKNNVDDAEDLRVNLWRWSKTVKEDISDYCRLYCLILRLIGIGQFYETRLAKSRII